MQRKTIKQLMISSLTLMMLSSCGTGQNNANSIENKSHDGTTLRLAEEEETSPLSAEEQLGQLLFFDTNLSEPAGMACASCHKIKSGFVDPDFELPVSQGIHLERFGNRNTPTAAYASFVPAFHYDEKEKLYVGGMFLDGNAKDLKAQAKGPFLNPVEMANPDAASVVKKVQRASYASQFKALYGEDAFADSDKAYDNIAKAIAAFESTELFHPFDSKYDRFLEGEENLSTQEVRGLTLFNGKGTSHTSLKITQ